MFSKAEELIGKEIETNVLNHPNKFNQRSRPAKYSNLKGTQSACVILSLESSLDAMCGNCQQNFCVLGERAVTNYNFESIA